LTGNSSWMARLPSRGKKVAAAAARGAGPVSKLQRVKAGKAAALVAPACPPGCAVVSADLLHHLQQEVGIKATAPHDEPKHEARHEPKSRPEPSKAEVRQPKRQKDPGSQEVLPLKSAAVLNDEVPPPRGARHAGVGTVQAVEEGTQTSFEENKAGAPPPRPQAVPQAGPLPTSAREGIDMRPTLNVNRHRVDGVTEATPLLHDAMLAPRQAAVAAPVAVAQNQPVEASQNYGRCDPFHLDRITAEKERDRKRVQAKMLAEQIQEQRERKEEELRRLREEELMEERRVARELREIEERHRREQAGMAAKSSAAAPEAAKAPGRAPVRRRRSKDPAGQDFSPSRGGGTYDGSTAGTWVDGEDRRRRRRRRRRDVDSTTGGGQDGSWRASERDKRTWRDENYSSLSLLPDGRDTSSPVPWLTASPQENAEAPDGLSTVLETGEMKRTEARPARGRRRRERRDFRERGDSYDENDTWESAANRKSQDDMHPQRVPVAADGVNWTRDPDDEQRRRRGRPQPPLAPRREMGTLEEVPALPTPAEKDRSPQRPAQMMTEAELRQIRSLVRVCEQLLRERAEEKEREAEKARLKGSPKHSLSPAARKTERLSPSRHGASKQEVSEEAPRLTSGAALASARSQATNSHTSGIGGSANLAGEGGGTSVGGASDMHSWGAREEPKAGPGQKGDPGEWSSDALMELMHGHSRMVGVDARLPGMDIPEGQAVSQSFPVVAPSAAAPSRGSGNPNSQGRMPPLSSLAESPFTSPARGVALRRSSRRDSRAGLGDPNSVFRSWGGRNLASPPPISRGGLNVQASWEPLGYDQGGRPHPFHKGSRHSGHRGPGQVPIGINPSIQAQSAMLREMYPNVAMGGPGPGPLSLAPTG